MSIDLSTIEYINKSAWVNISTATNFRLHPDGARGWIIDNASTGRKITEFLLTTPWDITTYVKTNPIVSFSLAQAGALNFQFSPDGTFCLVWFSDINSFKSYSLSTPWDVTTMTLITTKSFTSASNQYGFYLSSDGANLWCTRYNPDQVIHCTLSTPWNISTLALVSADTLDISGQFTNPTGIYFEPDGLTMHIADLTYDGIKSWALSTAWDISTAVYKGLSFDFKSGTENLYVPRNFGFGGPSTGVEYLYFFEGNGYLFQYGIPVYIPFQGTVTDNEIPVERTVRVYERITGDLIEEVLSSSVDGSFTLTKLEESYTYYIVVFDDDTNPDYNAKIYDWITVSLGS